MAETRIKRGRQEGSSKGFVKTKVWALRAQTLTKILTPQTDTIQVRGDLVRGEGAVEHDSRHEEEQDAVFDKSCAKVTGSG